MDGSAELLSGITVSVLVGVATYSAIFVALGVRFRRALIWGLAYILLWEGFVATAGAAAAKLAVRSYTRSILSEYTGVGIKLATMPLMYQHRGPPRRRRPRPRLRQPPPPHHRRRVGAGRLRASRR